MIHFKLFSAVFLTALGLSFAAGAATPTTLIDKHTAQGVSCQQCHQQKNPTKPKPVATATCFTCHGSHEALAQKTKDKDPNPHYTHMGDMNCNECHRIHTPSVNMCSSCHTIKMPVP